MSSCTVALLAMPFSNQTLQFMNVNGVVNIYMIVLSYMFSPSTDIDEEIVVDDNGNIKNSPSELKTESCCDSLDRVDSDEQGIQMQETNNFKEF